MGKKKERKFFNCVNAVLMTCLCICVLEEALARNWLDNTLTPDRLQVEYLQNPEGLDVELPRFSWTLRSSDTSRRGIVQTAYHILVASKPELLRKNKGDIWDSRWVISDRMQNVQYAGRPLMSDRKYYWKVMIKDEKDEASSWSDQSYWLTGILGKDEWKGKWIGSDQFFNTALQDCNIWDPWFRKTFSLDSQPGKATMFMASIGYHELYVNGIKVGDDVLAPAVSDHTKRARYLAYDIQPYLKKGDNIIALWLGTSWSIFAGYDVDGSRPLTPMANAQVDIYKQMYPDNRQQPDLQIITDNSWKWAKSSNKLLGNWDFRNMGGELWDDNQYVSDWNQISLDDSQWKNASVYPVVLKMSAQNVERNRKEQEIRPVKIEDKGDNTYRVDMGVNFAGWTAIKIRGRQNDTIKFLFSEREQDEMTFGIRNTYIIGASGEGTFENRFNYSSGRWITIKGLRQKPKSEDITGCMVRTDFTNATTFKTSDSLQNWIYDRVRWTFENLSIGGYIVDCPQRERMGYGGDAHATTETGMMNYQLGAFYSKWMQDWRDVQGTEPMVGNMRDTAYARKSVTSGRIFGNGVLPHTAPTYWGGGGPPWGGIVVTLPWFMYEHFGDRRVLEENFQLIDKWLAFLDSHVEDGLLRRFGGQWDFLGDWLWPNATAEGMNNDKPENICFNNNYRVFNLRTAAKIAGVLGEQEKAGEWERKAKEAQEAINKRYFDSNRMIYADGSMANLALALLAEVVPSEYKRQVWASLEKEILVHRDGHIHAGITGGALLFKLLRNHDRNDLIYSMLSKNDYPSWGYMRDNDATTIWEMWEKDLPGHSLLHSSYLFPGAWYIDGLAGIKSHPDYPGYKRFVIRIPNRKDVGIKQVDASYDSPVGEIVVKWHAGISGKRSLEIVIPPNSMAYVHLSKDEWPELIDKQSPYISLSDENDKEWIYLIASGYYHF